MMIPYILFWHDLQHPWRIAEPRSMIEDGVGDLYLPEIPVEIRKLTYLQ
ncbi:hypothetical protein [Acaryochloris marina]|uniref:Uncharacterized protein n=1 Tax=Acaryochloris marina (strain MBIC 11017) TaxID=329726 RepID=B0CCN1_ACAM1|nr:hypothetical protein [Acaryochloris marina]ABW29193.1 hypothetical protein AM1_4213 [Acaryochloris marina MBIC11017]